MEPVAKSNLQPGENIFSIKKKPSVQFFALLSINILSNSHITDAVVTIFVCKPTIVSLAGCHI